MARRRRSIGNDSAKGHDHPPLFNYLQQLFAPWSPTPVDPIREELVMSWFMTTIGAEQNFFEQARRIALGCGLSS